MRVGLAVFALALALALIAVGFGSAYYASQPTTLRAVVSASDSHSRQLLEAAADVLQSAGSPMRLRVTTADDGLAAIERGDADFAVARSVDLVNSPAQTVLVLRRDAAVIMVPKTGRIRTLPELVAADIGVVREGYMDGAGLAAVMNYYAIDAGRLKLTPLSAGEIAAAIGDKRINAVVVAGNLSAARVADVVAETARAFRGGVRFIDIEAAEAIAKRLPQVEAIEIEKGLFGGYPPRPDDTVNTVGVSVRLVAGAGLSKDRVADFLHAFDRVRQQVIARVSGSGGLAIPDPDDDSSFVLHQGVRAFNKGAIVGIVDRYSDQIYIGGLLASSIGSAFASALGMVEARRRRRSTAEVMEIQRLLDAIDAAGTDVDLADIEVRANEIFRFVLTKAMKGRLEPAVVAAFELAHREVRDRIAAKRLALAESPAPALTRVAAR